MNSLGKGNVNKVEKEIVLSLINIQALTNSKMLELENLLKGDGILFLTETHEKFRKVKIREDIEIYENMRELQDRKGGGNMCLHRKNDKFKLQKIENMEKDILIINGEIDSLKFVFVLVYFSVNDKARNGAIRKEVELFLRAHNDDNLFILGDFNGHVGFKGYQNLDENGKMVLEWMVEYNMVMLNDDVKCKGEITWQRGEQKSTVDFVLVTNKAYEYFKNMEIDEQKLKFDLSDHNLIEVTLKLRVDNPKIMKNKWLETVYYKKDEESLKSYKSEVEDRLKDKGFLTMKDLNRTMKEVADSKLKRVYRRKVIKREQTHEAEPPWITEEIRQGIKQRKKCNREKRNPRHEGEGDLLEENYQKAKRETQNMIKEAIYRYEDKTTKEIKDSKDKKLYELIDKLRNLRKKKEREFQLYDGEGEKIPKEKTEDSVRSYWKDIYEMNENKMEEVWSEGISKEYHRRQSENMVSCEENEKLNITEVGQRPYTVECRKGLREHLDMTAKVEKNITYMEFPSVTEEQVKKHFKKLKKGKAAGPDGMKPEFYKALEESHSFVKAMRDAANKITEEESAPSEWRESNTAMIKDKIEEHIAKNEQVKETQSGFTEKGRIENNLVILKYCIEKTFEKKQPLYVISIDFSKAYDSLKRENLIEVLKDYKIHANII